MQDSFGVLKTFVSGGKTFSYHSLPELSKRFPQAGRLPYSLQILLENLLRHEDGKSVKKEDIEALACWTPGREKKEIMFMPARVLLQDFTGVPALVDFAAMRDAMAEQKGDPKRINPLIPAELVIDHSVQVDVYGSRQAFKKNQELEFRRNQERYTFLKWGQKAFANFRVIPPGVGICHQVNLEYLARVVFQKEEGGKLWAYPDTLVGTDSHTTMVNGLGVLGWGVGGIEAEAAMLGQSMAMLIPDVVGVRLSGSVAPGVTATDVVLTVTEMLRRHGVVGKFVEFFGPGLSSLSLADRATIANMAPEYGATCGLFPVDAETLSYLRLTGRPKEVVELAEAYARAQGFWQPQEEPLFSEVLELDLGKVEASIAGPRRPQDRVPLAQAKEKFLSALSEMKKGARAASAQVEMGGQTSAITDGAVAIAAITSCTNTSNPSVLLAAGILAKKANEAGLATKPWVKTSFAPGSQAVSRYLEKTGLMPSLEALGFYLTGYGCTVCIGNTGPLPEPVTAAIERNGLTVAAVLSGNRNFEGRIHPLVKMNYLASPPLVVAYALCGKMDISWEKEPIGQGKSGPVFLRDIWPTPEEIKEALSFIGQELYQEVYAHPEEGDDAWRALEAPSADLYSWDEKSTYVRRPPYFERMKKNPSPPKDIVQARVLALLGDSVTTDHISPAGSIALQSPAGQYLTAHGVVPEDFNSYGARRGNHEVMMRGTFANVRLRNLIIPEKEGSFTRHFPEGEPMWIYEAAMKYQKEQVSLLVVAGKEYGSGSSRDWAAKGPHLLGVKAVLAQSFERIHRSNLVGMGILPLEFLPGENASSLGLTGDETYAIVGLEAGAAKEVQVQAQGDAGEKSFTAKVRIDSPQEILYFQHGGILLYVLRAILQGG